MFSRKRSLYAEFGIPAPTKYLSKVWHICDHGNLEKPLLFYLPDDGRKYHVFGWVTPAQRSSELEPGICFSFNRKYVYTCGDSILPDNAFELAGFVGCNSDYFDFSPELAPILENQISSCLEKIFNVWLVEGVNESDYNRIIQPRIDSPSLRDRELMKMPQYVRAFSQHHKFVTTGGPMNLFQLLKAAFTKHFTIRATSALAIEHELLKEEISSSLVVDLRQFFPRMLAAHIIESQGLELGFVDLEVRKIYKNGTLTDNEAKLKRWFDKGFKNSLTHQEVQVRFVSPERLAFSPVAVLPNRKPLEPCPSSMSPGEFDCAWLQKSTLIVNPVSPLALKILEFSDKSKSYRYLPVAIHNLASLFALGTFMSQYQTIQWEQMAKDVKSFYETEKKLMKTKGMRNENRQLKEQMQKQEEKMAKLIEKINLYRGLLGDLENSNSN